MSLVDAIVNSSARGTCRIFLVTRDGATAGCAGRALADAAGPALAVTGSTVLPRYDAAAADAILAAAAAGRAQYVIAGVSDADARALVDRARQISAAPAIIAVGDELQRLAMGVRRPRA